MTIPFVCDGANIIALEPTLHGGWWWCGVTLVVLALCCVVAASLWAPVAGPFARSEERTGSLASGTFIGISGIAVVCVLFGLSAMQVPLGCSTHGILVSAAIPASSDPDARHLAEEARASVPTNRAVRDLSGVRDAVLQELMKYAGAELSQDTVTGAVRKAITHTMRYGFPEPIPAARAEALKEFDSSVIEGIEIAVLMGWRALYSGDDQHLTYIASNRSEKYGWSWDTFSNRYFRQDHTDKDVLDVRLVGESSSGAPVLTQPVRARKVNAHSLIVEALFATHGAAGSATIHLTGPYGEISKTTVLIPAGAGTNTLADLRFNDVADVDKGDTLRQQTDEGTIIVRRLPTPHRDRINLDLRRYEELRDTFKFLAGDTTSCSGGGDDLVAQVGEWRTTFSRPQDATPMLDSDESDKDKVALVRAPFGGLIVLPPDSGFEANIDLTRLRLGKPQIQQLAAPGRVIAWGTSATARRYDLERLGMDGVVGTLVPADASVPVAIALAQDRLGIAAHRLDREDVGNAVGAGLIMIALKDNDPEKPSLRHRAAILLGDPVALGVVCGKMISETEVFLAYWHTVLDAVATASVPVSELSPLDTAPSQMLPAIYLDTVAQQKIASARLELPLLLLTGAFLTYVSLVVIAYLRAMHVFGE